MTGTDFALPAGSVSGARTSGRGPRLVRCAFWTVVALGTLSVAGVLAINAFMSLSVRGEVTTVDQAPQAQAAIVLGALVNPDGSMSAMLADRVQRGAELYKAGKVDKIIVSGDHGTWEYDEPNNMRKALQSAGVPAADIFTDHAGFDTWHSMRRAREVFGVESAIVVTQGFHMTRALFLADHAGLKASGVTSDIQPYGSQQQASEVREFPARVKAFGSVFLGQEVLLGPAVPITGDGRSSWGPQEPPAN